MDAAVEFAVAAPYPDPIQRRPKTSTPESRTFMAQTATAVRELTFGDAIKEAIAEEMRRDPHRRPDRRGRGRGRHHLQGADGPGGRVRHGPRDRHADLRGRLHGPRRGRGDDRHAADRRHHVRRLPDDHHGPAGQPGRQDPLHVGRARGRCRWWCAARWARRAGRPRSTRSRCTRGRATCRASRWSCRRRPTTPRASSRRPSATTTRWSSSSTRSATAR